MRARFHLGSERGQSLVMFTIFLPVLALFFSFVVDGGHMFLEKRSVQNAADAAALAAVQEVWPAFDPACDAACRDVVVTPRVRDVASDYSIRNGGPAIDSGGPALDDYCTDRYPQNDPDPSRRGYPIPPSDPLYTGPDDNCFTWPWKGSDGLVEVKLRSGSANFLVSSWFLTKLSSAPARAVASYQEVYETRCVPADPPGTEACNIVTERCDLLAEPTPEPPEGHEDECRKEGNDPPPGFRDVGETSHCTFAQNEDDDPSNDISDPDQYLGTDPPCTIVEPGDGGGVEGSQGFAMSRVCDAILYRGTPGTGQSDFPILGAFGTNGGLTFLGTGGKRLDTLGFDKARCGSLLPEPPNGDPAACDAAATVLPKGQRQSCVRNLVDFGDQLPLNWPVTPPMPPTPLPPGTTWDPVVDYPRRCTLLSPPPGGDTVTLNVVPGPPGIYCVSGPTTVLVIANDMTAGDGYTFFALDGARIEVASNGTDVKFYWPSACPSPDTGVVGERPTTRRLSFVCFDRRIVGYDPLTLFYSSQSTAFPAGCEESAICIHGQGGVIEGDVFAPEPRSAAPPTSLTQGGGTVWIAGGGAAAGDGFVEAWLIRIEGNSATYNGTGPLLGGNPVIVTQGTLELGEDAHCIFPENQDDDPDNDIENPDQYLDTEPPCDPPATPDTYYPWVVLTEYRELERVIVDTDIGMDE